jgi:O-antigen/teichoic acid export membrane protein
MAYALLRARASSAAAVLPLVAFRASAGGLPIAIGLYVAHRWGLRELAAYTVASAMVAVALVLTDWGISRLLPREIALLQRSSAVHFVARTNGLRVVLVLACLAVLFAASKLQLIAPDVATYMYLLLPTCAVAILSTNAVSERVASGEVHAISVGVVAGIVSFLAAAVPLSRMFEGNGYALVVAYVISKCVEAAILVRGRTWMVRTGFEDIGRLLISMWPFSVQALVAVIYSRLPIFLIERMGTSRQEVGLVSAGVALRNVLLLLPASMAFLSYPALSVAARDRDAGQRRQIVTTYLVVCITGVFASIGLLVVFIHPICAILHIPVEQQTFTVVFVAATVTAIGTALVGVELQAFGGEQIAARLSLITVLLSVGYYVAAIAYWGVWGTVWALVGGEMTVLVVIGRAAFRLKNSRFQYQPFPPVDVVTGA